MSHAQSGDVCQTGVGACGRDHGEPLPFNGKGPGQKRLTCRHRDRNAFAGERGRVDEQAVCLGDLQIRRDAVGPVLLRKGEEAVEENDDRDGRSEFGHARQQCKPARDPQHEGEQVNELRDQAPPRGDARRSRKPVRTVAAPAGDDIVTRQPARRDGFRREPCHGEAGDAYAAAGARRPLRH